MGHNKDRRPTYPAEKKKNYGKAIFNLLKNGWEWLCFTIVVLCFIYIIVKNPIII